MANVYELDISEDIRDFTVLHERPRDLTCDHKSQLWVEAMKELKFFTNFLEPCFRLLE